MTPWLWASSLFVASSEDEDEEESVRREALGLPPLSSDPQPPSAGGRDGRSIFEMFTDRTDEEEGLVYTVDIGDGYTVRAFGEYSEAVSEAEGMVDSALNGEGTDEIFVTKYEHVPHRLRLRALLHGVRHDRWRNTILGGEPDVGDFGDGYEVSGALNPYLSQETESGDPKQPWEEKGVVWKWNLSDEKFEDWPTHKQEEHREEVYYRYRPKGPLRKGLRLYLRTTDPEPFLEAQAQDGSGLDEPVVVATRKDEAPMDPMVPAKEGVGNSIVTIELQEQIEAEHVVVVPWVPNGGANQWQIDEISEMLGEAVDPKAETVFLDDICKNVEKQSQYFKVLVIETDDRGGALLFLDPGRSDVPVKVVNVEEG